MRTGKAISWKWDDEPLSFFVPEKLKAGNVTNVVIADFGKDFDPEPYLFRHW